MAGRRILLTGTSGLGMTHVLKQLKQHSTEPMRCCKAEKHFLKHVKETRLVEYLDLMPEPERMISALELPQQVLLECWRKAFLELADANYPDLDNTKNTDTEGCDIPIVLAAHMCFYHQQSREFVPLVDADLLARRFEPDVIVTLIDDVEHMFKRLREPGQMYANHHYEGFGGVAQACRDLSQLVHWRASETAFAKSFARPIEECDHFLLAVKHPVSTLGALLFEPGRPLAYVSHAISEPRRRLAAGDSGTFEAFCEELERASAVLRTRAVLFEPTAIDEFRFRSFTCKDSQGDTGRIPLPTTTDRWPLLGGENDLLWSYVADDNPVDPKGHFKPKQLDDFEAAKRTLDKADSRPLRGWWSRRKARSDLAKLVEVENATHLVRSLVGEIGRSVTSRDLQLVEQADHLIVVRPLFNGNSSGGVEKEIRQHCRLYARGGRPRKGILVFTAKDDENKWRLHQVASWLHRFHLQNTGVSEEVVREAIKPVEQMAVVEANNPHKLKDNLDTQVVDMLGELTRLVSQKWGVQLVATPRGSGDDPLKDPVAVAAARARAELTEKLQETITPSYLSEWEYYKDNLDCEVPLTIYWGSPWPRPQDLAGGFGGLEAT